MKRARIEAAPKDVEIVTLADGSFATRPGIDPKLFVNNILDIRRHIVAGLPLPEHYYRRTVGRDYSWNSAAGCICMSVTISTTTCC